MTWFLFAIIVGLAIYRLVDYHKKVKAYYKVKAVVTGIDVKEVDDTLMGAKYFYAPIIEFTDKYHRPQQMISGEDNPDRPLYKVGAELTILVHPDDSSRFIMYDFISGYLIPIIWLLIGTAIPLIPMIWPEVFAD
jgi:hypothetical protein